MATSFNQLSQEEKNNLVEIYDNRNWRYLEPGITEEFKLASLLSDALMKDYPDSHIPIEVFRIIEKDLLPYIKACKLRVEYRGAKTLTDKRFYSKSKRVKKAEAQYVVLF